MSTFINPETYIFTFGKYKGKSYRYVMADDDPDRWGDARYIRWCHWKVEWFTLSPDEFERVKAQAHIEDMVFRKPSYRGMDSITEYFLEVYGNDIMY